LEFREATGFLDKAARLVGSARVRDEIARVLEMDLLTVPSFGEALFDEFRAVTLLTDPQLTVFYQVLYAENLIEFVDIEPV
jgi:hypothetical protein